MNSMPVGTLASAGFWASCPAPLERTGASTPTLAAALANRSRMVRSSGVGGIALKRSMEVSSPRASDTRFTASRKSAITASMRDCSAARTSIVKTHSPGTTFFAPGRTLISPTVPTVFSRDRARGHDRRTRVIGAALHGDAAMHDADDVAHHAERTVGLSEPRALLDVELEIGRDLARIASRERGVALLAERAQRVGHRDTAPIRALRDAGGKPVERCRGSEQADAESRPLLVRPGDDLDWSLEAGTDIEERLDRLDGADDSERTVESTALGHRVDVRADEHDRIAVTLARETREQISGRVATHLRAARGAPRGDQIARGLFLRGEPEPGNRAVARTDRGELVDTFLEPEEVAHVMRCASSSSGANGRPENTSASSAFAAGSARSISEAKPGCRSAVPRARRATDSTRRPPRRSATYTILSASVAGAVAGSSTV